MRRKTIRLKCISLLITAVLLCSAFFCSSSLFAVGDAGNQGGNGSTNSGGGQIVGTEAGGGWVFQEWPAGHTGDLVIPDYGCAGVAYCFRGGTIRAICSQTKGYWRSAWFYNGDPNQGLIGLNQNSNWRIFGIDIYNSSKYRTDTGATNIDVIKKQYDLAESRGHVPNGVNWNNVSWFCSDGDVTDTPDPVEGSTNFYSTSTVTVNDPDITGGKTATSEKDGKVKVEFSTDKTSVTVDFSHTIGHDHGSFTMNSEDTASGGAVTTNWAVTGAYDVGRTSWGALRPSDNHTTTPDTAKKSVTITFGENEYGSKEACSKVDYDRKNASLTGKWVCDEQVCNLNGCTCTKGHYNYTATYSDKGSSEACAKVTRPEPPSGEPKNPGGDTNSKIMFAGEDTKLWWDGIHAESHETRRLSGWNAIKFQVDQTAAYNSNNFSLDANSKLNPCAMYAARFGTTLTACVDHESDTLNGATPHTYSKDASVKVPDYVGHKYCNSFGYNFEYWYKIEGSSNPNLNDWHHDDAKDYWYNFGAACRTIAKKPTIAAWNGSVMTTGDIITSLASRHNSITFGETSNNDRTLFGSWSEYLTIANTNLNPSRTMASGASLSTGSANLKLCEGKPWETNSSLTISNFNFDANICSLTPSGITGNATFLTRLYAYLRNATTNPNITITSNIADLYGGLNSNTVATIDGDLTITQNIQANDTVSYNIHNVPQTIIFVNDGNVNISENVSRIDAWLIVTGNSNKGIINTCAEFTPGANTTPGTNSDGLGSSGNQCTKQLVFNGPVIARQINLNRSYGSDPLISRTSTFGTPSSKQAPAEIFNLRADSYLWGYAQASRYNSSYNEVYTRELAPRY